MIINKIKPFLIVNKMDQKELSKKINCTESAMSYWVHGKRIPRLLFALRIAKVFKKRRGMEKL